MSDASKPKHAQLIDELSTLALKVKQRGDDKHGPGTWAHLSPVQFVDAAIRHLVAIRDGEWHDEDTGAPHWACVLVNAHYGYASEMLRRDKLPQQRLDALLRLQDVKRFHIMRRKGEQTVAAHTFNVQCIGRRYLQLSGQEYLIPVFLERALLHDSEESLFGDVPTPAKPARSYADASEVDFVLKMADLLDGWREATECAMGAYGYKATLKLQDSLQALIDQRFGAGCAPGAYRRLVDEVFAMPVSADEIAEDSS